MIGTKLAHYEITSHLGSGGMGDVYQATDSKLGRDVAIKFLPEAFSHDNDRVARFEREARVLALLNHSNIAAIFGLEESGERRFLVMELVEGETLAERIKRGPIPVDESLGIARQICEALESAHEKGIIHRDLKPANVKITLGGKVKVLDFGLAKVFENEPANAALSNSPTLRMAATMQGAILGTAAYMSPEQAKGMTVDRRTDIFAFGAVLYEMLTGGRAFAGETLGDILAAVIKTEPDWSRLRADTPVGIRRLLRRCLQKDRNRRIKDAADVGIEIEEARTEPDLREQAVEPAVPRTLERMAWVVALAVIMAVAIAALYFRAPPELPEMRVEINTPATTGPISFAISPDGRRLVFVASENGQARLWLRPLDAVTAQPLAGTEGASYPFWSPDNRSVGFFANSKLKRIDIGGGQPLVLADASLARGGTWNADGIILFSRGAPGPLLRVSASGGEAVPVTKLDRQHSYLSPYFLPDGRQFLFYALGPPETPGIYLGSLDSEETKRLTAADNAGVYAPSGWLLWVRAGALVAQRLDLVRRELAYDRVTVADPVAFEGGARALSVSAAGLLAYRPGHATRRSQLTWFDRSGKALDTIGESGFSQPSLSADGRRIAVTGVGQANRAGQANTFDIWLLDADRTIRFTFNAASERYPIWSPDGSRIVFTSTGNGHRDLYQKKSSGVGSAELLVETPQDKFATDWSADGRFLLYQSNDSQTNQDLWVLPLEGDHKPWVFLKTNFNEGQGQFSPDGRWVAYESDESGRWEIYVRSFAAPAATGAKAGRADGRWQVSTAGGVYPRWRPDGKELYYVGPDGQFMAASVTATGAALAPGTPVALFQTRIYGGSSDNGQGRQYDVARDGRFLINTIVDDVASPITLIQNWKPPAK